MIFRNLSEVFYFVNQKTSRFTGHECLTEFVSNDPGRPCLFPFKEGNVTYNKCKIPNDRWVYFWIVANTPGLIESQIFWNHWNPSLLKKPYFHKMLSKKLKLPSWARPSLLHQSLMMQTVLIHYIYKTFLHCIVLQTEV